MLKAPLLLSEFRRHAAERPDALALRAPDGEISWGRFIERCDQIACRLRQDGCETGDRVAILGRNSLCFLEVLFGTMFARCVAVPLSTSAAPDVIARMLEDSRPRMAFIDADRHAGFDVADVPVRIVHLDVDGGDAAPALERWLAEGGGRADPQAWHEEDLLTIIYSSGTTGVPKGIAHSHRSRTDFVATRPKFDNPEERLAYISTAIYTNLSFIGLIGPLYSGLGVLVPDRFSAEGFIEAVAEQGVTDVSIVPVQLQRILDAPTFDRDRMAGLRTTVSSGSPVGHELKRRLAASWPGTLLDGYGTTETGAVAFLDITAFPDKLDSVGQVAAGSEFVILDDDNKVVPTGEVGEILCWNISMMEGYYNRDDLTKDSRWRRPDGRVFLRTGDTGRVDEDGFLFITGRKKDMIISGGLNIYAIDLEEELNAHPDVREAAVIAIPSEKWGESPYAIVVLEEGAAITEAALLDWANARLSKSSRLAGIDFCDVFPRNDMGKVLKRELREPFWAGRSVGVA